MSYQDLKTKGNLFSYIQISIPLFKVFRTGFLNFRSAEQFRFILKNNRSGNPDFFISITHLKKIFSCIILNAFNNFYHFLPEKIINDEKINNIHPKNTKLSINLDFFYGKNQINRHF